MISFYHTSSTCRLNRTKLYWLYSRKNRTTFSKRWRRLIGWSQRTAGLIFSQIITASYSFLNPFRNFQNFHRNQSVRSFTERYVSRWTTIHVSIWRAKMTSGMNYSLVGLRLPWYADSSTYQPSPHQTIRPLIGRRLILSNPRRNHTKIQTTVRCTQNGLYRNNFGYTWIPESSTELQLPLCIIISDHRYTYLLLVSDDHSEYCWLFSCPSTSTGHYSCEIIDWFDAFCVSNGLMYDGPKNFRNETVLRVTKNIKVDTILPFCTPHGLKNLSKVGVRKLYDRLERSFTNFKFVSRNGQIFCL